MFKIILYGFLLYLLYKFIFELVVPVSKVSSQVKSKIREMQAQQMAHDEQVRNQQSAAKSNATKPSDDYIEFEEVK